MTAHGARSSRARAPRPASCSPPSPRTRASRDPSAPAPSRSPARSASTPAAALARQPNRIDNDEAQRIRVAVLIAAALAASGCSIFKQRKDPKTPVLGERIAVLTSESEVAGRSGDRGAADERCRRPSPTPIGRSRAATPPSRWASSRSASARHRPYRPGRRGSSLRAARRRRRSSPTAGSTRSTRWARCARSMRRTGARSLGEPDSAR